MKGLNNACAFNTRSRWVLSASWFSWHSYAEFPFADDRFTAKLNAIATLKKTTLTLLPIL